jgi:hypothetical protein
MAGEISDQPCLFGWPAMPWKGMRGRPPHVPSAENVNKVKMLLAFGWSNERIANALNITQPTLRRHYLSVLKVRAIARDALDARRAELLWQQVEKGNVGAMKAFDRFLEQNDRMTRSRLARDDEDEDEIAPTPPKPSGYVGKKGLATDAAQAALVLDPDLQPGRGTKAH